MRDSRRRAARSLVRPSLSDADRVPRHRPDRSDGPLRWALGAALVVGFLITMGRVVTSCAAFYAETAPSIDEVPGDIVSAASDSGTLWVAHERNGLTRVDPSLFRFERLTRDSTGGGLPTDRLVDVSAHEGEVMVIAGPEQRAVVVRGPQGAWTRAIGGGRLPGLEASKVLGAAARGTDLLLLLADGTLGRYDRRHRELSELLVDPALPERAEDVACDALGVPWILAGGELFVLDRTVDGKWRPRKVDPPGGSPAELTDGPRGVVIRTQGDALVALRDDSTPVTWLAGGRSFPDLDLGSVAWLAATADGSAVWLLQRSGRLGRYEVRTGRWSHVAAGAASSSVARPVMAPDGRRVIVPLAQGGARWFEAADGAIRPGDGSWGEWRVLWLDDAGEGVLAVLEDGKSRRVVRQPWSGGGSASDLRRVDVVPGGPGRWVDTFSVPEERILAFVGADGRIRHYGTEERSFLRGQVWALEGDGSQGEDRFVAARENDGWILAVRRDGALFQAPRWDRKEVEGAVLPLRGVVGVERLPAPDPAGFVAAGRDLFAVMPDGGVYECSLDRGIRDEHLRVRPGAIRRLNPDRAVVVDAEGAARVRGEGAWEKVASEVARLGHGDDALPLFFEDGRVAVLEGSSTGATGGQLERWLPEPPTDDVGPVLPLGDVVADGKGGLLVADAGGVRRYDLDAHEWRSLVRDPGRGDWSWLQAGERLWAFSGSRRRVRGFSKDAPSASDAIQGVEAVAVRDPELLIQYEDGSIGTAGSKSAAMLLARPDERVPDGPILGMAVDGERLLMIASNRSLLEYRPAEGRLALVEPSWLGGAPVAEVRSRGATVALRTETGEVHGRLGGRSWRRLGAADDPASHVKCASGGVVVGHADGRTIWRRPPDLRIPLTGRPSKGTAIGRLIDRWETEDGLWLVGERGGVFWNEGRLALDPDGRFRALGAWKGFLEGSGGLWGCWERGLVALTGRPEWVLRTEIRDATVLEGDPLVLTVGGELLELRESRARRLNLGRPARQRVEGRVTRVVPWNRGYLLSTENCVAQHDVAARRLHVLAGGGGAVRRIGVFDARKAWAWKGDQFQVYGDEEKGVVEEVRDVRDCVAVDGEVWIARGDGEVRRVGRSDRSTVLAPGRGAEHPAVERVVPVRGGLVLRGDGVVWRYRSATRRTEAFDWKTPILLPWRDDFAVGRSGSEVIAVPLAGEPLGWEVRGLRALRGDGRSVVGWGVAAVFELAASGPRNHFLLPTEAPRWPPRAAANAQGNLVLHVLDRDGRLWSYLPRRGRWLRGPKLSGADEIVLSKGGATYLIAERQLLDLSEGERRETRLRARADARGNVVWVDEYGDLHRNDSVLWRVPMRLPRNDPVHWTVGIADACWTRFDSALVCVEADEARKLGEPLPPTKSPDQEAAGRGSMWLRFGQDLWELQRHGAQAVRGDIRSIAGVMGSRALVVTQRDSIEFDDRTVLLRPPPDDPVFPDDYRVVPSRASEESILVHARRSLWTRDASIPRAEWRSWFRNQVEEVVPRRARYEVRGSRGDQVWCRLVTVRRGRVAVEFEAISDGRTLRFGGTKRGEKVAMDLRDWAVWTEGSVLRDRGTGLLVSVAAGRVAIAGRAGSLGWDLVAEADAAEGDGYGNVAVRVGGEWWGLAALLAGAKRPTSEWTGGETRVRNDALGLFRVEDRLCRPSIVGIVPADTDDVRRAGGWKTADGLWWVYTSADGYLAFREDGHGLVHVLGAVMGPRGWGADLSDLDVRFLGSLPAKPDEVTESGLVYRATDGMLVIGPSGIRIRAAPRDGEHPSEPRVPPRVDRYGLLDGERDLRPRVFGGRVVLEWRGRTYAHGPDGWRPAILDGDSRDPGLGDSPEVHVGRASVRYVFPGRASSSFDRRLGVFFWDRIDRLVIVDGQPVVRFGDGTIRRWRGRRWAPWEGGLEEPAERDRVALRPPFVREGDVWKMRIGSVAVPLNWRAKGGFVCDEPIDVMPADHGVYVLTADALWLASEGSRYPVVGVRITSDSRLALGDDGRAVLVTGSSVWRLDGARGERVLSGGVHSHPCDGRLRLGALSVLQTGGEPPRFALRTPQGDVPTRFVGIGFEHDLCRRLVVSGGAVWIVTPLADVAWRPTGPDQRVFARDLQADPEPLPPTVARPDTTFRYHLEGAEYRCQIPGPSGWVDAGWTADRRSLAVDRPHAIAAAGRSLFLATEVGCIVQDARDWRRPRSLAPPASIGSWRLRSRGNGGLWAHAFGRTMRLDSGRWVPAETEESPFSRSRREAEAWGRWRFRWKGERVQAERRFSDGFRTVGFLPEEGNFDFALLATGRTPWFDMVREEPGSGLRVLTRAGPLLVSAATGQRKLIAGPWGPPSAPREEVVEGGNMEVRVRHDGRTSLHWRGRSAGGLELGLEVRGGRLPIDRVRAISSVPERETLVVVSEEGLREWRLDPKGVRRASERLFRPPGWTSRGARVVHDGTRTCVRLEGSGRVFAPEADGAAWTETTEDVWNEVSARAFARPGGLEGTTLRWERTKDGVVFRVGGGAVLDLGREGFRVDRPEDAAVVGGYRYLLSKASVWRAPKKGSVAQYERLGSGRRFVAVSIDRAGRTVRATAVETERGVLRVLERSGSIGPPVRAPDSPWEALVLPHRVVRLRAGDHRIEWRGKRRADTRLRDGRFLHDVVRDVLPLGEGLLLATADGLVLRTGDENAWRDHRRCDAKRLLRAAGSVVVLGSDGSARPVALGTDGIERIGPPVQARPETIHRDPVFRVLRTGNGPAIEASVGAPAEWRRMDPGIVEKGELPWDAIQAFVRFANPREGATEERFVAIAPGFAHPCRARGVPLGPLRDLPDGTVRVERIGGECYLLWGSGDSGSAALLRPDGSVHPVPRERVAEKRETKAGPWTFRGPDPRGVVQASYAFVNGRKAVGAREGCFDPDRALAVETSPTWLACLTRAGVGIWAPGEQTMRHVAVDDAARFVAGTLVTDQGDLGFSDGQGAVLLVRRDGRIRILPREALGETAADPLAVWPGGGMFRRAGVLLYRDATTGLRGRGPGLFHDERFAFDDARRLGGPYLWTSGGLQRWSGGAFVPARRPEDATRFERYHRERSRCEFELGATRLRVTPEGVRVGDRPFPAIPRPILCASRFGRRLWLVSRDGVRFLRLEARWAERTLREAGHRPR